MIAFEKSEIEGTVGGRFRNVAARIPDRTAVRTAGAALTYAELDARTEALARRILARRGPAPEPVALLLEQGAESVLALLGILKAGKSAVVLSPDFPPSRLEAIWNDLRRPLIVTRAEWDSLAESLAPSAEDRMDLAGPPEETPAGGPPAVGPDSAAALFYTSGTTGEPKGVILSHRLILHTAWHNHSRYQIAETDRVVLISSHGFGASVALALSVLLSGATLHLPDSSVHPLPALIDYLRRERITILVLPSYGLLRQQAGAMSGRVTLPSLRHILIGGEQLDRVDLQRFRDFFPEQAEFSYRIASSETMMISELRIAPGDPLPWEKIPIGRMIPDKELLLLDDDGRPAAAGEPGEIAVRSRYLADGYWGRPDLSQAKFLPDPDGGDRRICLTGDMGRLLPDGLLEHLGRKDNVVRVRGFSVQLDAVARALESLPGVKEAAAATAPLSGGGSRLVAYIVPAGPDRPSVPDLRKALVAVLPIHMVPTAYVFLAELPRNVANRVDRTALPPPGSGRPELGAPLAPPRDETERRLARVWSEVLGVDPVGIDDDFFLLGGDSLLGMHLVLRIEEEFKRPVPSAFFRTPTIRRLGGWWREAVSGPPPDAGPAAEASGSRRRRGGRPVRFRQRHQIQTTKLGPYTIPPPLRPIRVAAELLPLQLSFPAGCRWLQAWCGRPEVIRRFYPAEAGLFGRWTENLGGCPDAPADSLSVAVLNNILWSTRYKRSIPLLEGETLVESMRSSSARFHRDLARRIERFAPGERERLASFEGLENVEGALRAGQGVILLSYHGAANRFAGAILARRLGSPIPTLSLTYGRNLELKKPRREGARWNEPALLANAAVEGIRKLKQGGIVQVVPDIGYDSADGVPLTIAGHRFLIKPGFAELALAAGAAVIPIYSTRRIDGGLRLRILPPFEPPGSESDRQARVDGLLARYAEFVEAAWKAAPESLLWSVIDQHLNRPAGEITAGD